MKFGGMALSSPINQNKVIEIIKRTAGKILVVCSAMGRIGYSYSTDNLAYLVEKVYITNKEYDELLACGETISKVRLSYLLNKENIKSYALSLTEMNLICDNSFSNGKILFCQNEIMLSLFEKYQVLIAPGFIGRTNEYQVITLGRGNSDLSAVYLAKSLSQKIVYLYKNVDGVYHTSPSVFKKLIKYDYLSYDQMLTLSMIGFEIISYRAIELAKKEKITIIVKSYLEDNSSTIITNEEANEEILGFNFKDKNVLIATFYPCLIKEKIELELQKKHIFIDDIIISENYLEFEVNKSIMNIVKAILIKMIENQKK